MNNGFYEFSRGKQETTSSVFPYTGSALITGSLGVTGSISATQGFTGSLFGTSSWASKSISSSFSTSSSFAISSSRSVSSSFAISASWAPSQTIDTSSLVTTSSFNSFTSSYNTGSFTGSFRGDGSGLINLPGQSINTSSLATTGSNTFIGNQVITGSLNVTQGITGSLFGTASWATNAIIATTALNGGVTQLLAGPNVTLSPTNGLGQVTISSTSGGGGFNTATGSYGSFYSTQTQTNVAGTARSMSLNTTDITNGVSVSGSTNPFNTYIKTENAGVYDIQFSAQVDKTDSGTDEIWIWLRKNGTNLTDTATSIQLVGNGAHYVAAWNFFVNAAANDYFQLMWYSPDANVRLHAEAGFGVVPGIPSLIVTANRVDQFLSNTGSFSGQFSGSFSGSGANLNSIPASAITGLNLSQLATGSVTASVSPTQFTVSSASVDEFTVTGTGVTLGSAITDTHRVTGSLTVTGSITATTYNNLPTASVSSSGILSSTDWTTFNNKQNTSTLIFDSIQKAIMRDNYFWFVPNTVSTGLSSGFGYSERIMANSFTLLNNGVLTRGMISFNTTIVPGILAFSRRNDALILTGLEVVFTRKIQFNSNVSGQRFFSGISKGNQFVAPTNVEPSTLTDVVGVCQLSSSTNMHVVHNDASGTATTIDLGSSYPCTDSQYNYFITIEQTTTTYIVTVERVTIATGASISTTNTLATNIPNYATGVIQLLTWISNNATAAIASYLDGGAIGNVKNQ
jgi:hypothetical protein